MAEVLTDQVNEARGLLAEAFAYQEWLPICEWAPGSIYLDSKITDYPGMIDIDRVPYHWCVLEAWDSGLYNAYSLVWAAQNAKSTLEEVVFGYVCDMEPSATMLAFPDQNLAKRRSRTHYMPMIRNSPRLARHLTGRVDDLQMLEYHLKNMNVMFGWAGSSSSLSAESIRVLIIDEGDKWEHRDKKEAHPYYLALERLTAKEGRGIEFSVTTPNDEDAPIWNSRNSGTQHVLFVPCPHCGNDALHDELGYCVCDRSIDDLKPELMKHGYQALEFSRADLEEQQLAWGKHGGFTGWGDNRDPDKCGRMAYYECQYCGGEIHDDQKMEMLRKGIAVPKHPQRSRFWFRVPRWYSPFVRFGKVVRDFYKAQGDPEDLRNWMNSTKAWIWKEMGIQKSEEMIRAHCVSYEMGTVPFAPIAITMHIDLGDDEFWYVVRAWREHEGSALVERGMLPRINRPQEYGDEDTIDPSFRVLDSLLTKDWIAADGNTYGLNIILIDNGYDTARVNDYVRNKTNVFATEGIPNQRSPLQYSRPETIMDPSGKKHPRPDSVYQVNYNADYFKDLWAAKMDIEIDAPGAWWLPTPIDDVYCNHLTGEMKKKVKNKRGRYVWMWVRTHANHYLDNEAGNLVAARLINVRDGEAPEQNEKGRGDDRPAGKKGNWITMGR